MKTTKHNLSAIALGVALATGSLQVLAGGVHPTPTPTPNPNIPPVINPAGPGSWAIIAAERAAKAPTLNRNEQVGLCLVESVVSLLAARTNDFGCDPKEYDLTVASTSPGVADAIINGGAGVGGTTLHAVLNNAEDIGTRCHVEEDDSGKNQLFGVPVKKYHGNHGWSRGNEIFNSDAKIVLKDPQTDHYNHYKEVDIKDFFKTVVGNTAWEFDFGLEDIKKSRLLTEMVVVPGSGDSIEPSSFQHDPSFYYPVQKWQELSWYSHENGQEGALLVKKTQIIPKSARCKIKLVSHDVFNGTGEFELGATVTVGK